MEFLNPLRKKDIRSAVLRRDWGQHHRGSNSINPREAPRLPDLEQTRLAPRPEFRYNEEVRGAVVSSPTKSGETLTLMVRQPEKWDGLCDR